MSIKNKEAYLNSLPLTAGAFTIRRMNREDLELRADWPGYPEPYAMFNASYRDQPQAERDRRWESIKANPEVICLSVSHAEESLVGIYYLNGVDWETKGIRNMAIRIHPHWCDRGIGTMLLEEVIDWCFERGITSLRLDVLSTNQRAIRSYTKAGFQITGSFHREEALFYWMERRC